MSSEGFNGWTNYETWCVKLWIDNSYDSDYLSEIVNDDCNRVADVADYFQVAHEDAADELFSDMSVLSDLLRASLRAVNWYEIATHLWDDYRIAEDGEESED